MFRSQRAMDAALTRSQAKSKRSEVKRTAVDNPHRPKLKKDPGVPDLRAAKSKLDHRAKREQQRQAKHQQHRESRTLTQALTTAVHNSNSADFIDNSVGTAAATHSDTFATAHDTSVKTWYYKELRQLIEDSDIILEVLDCRDPLGCRNELIERTIISSLQSDQTSSKRLILILNKIDLIPFDTLSRWLKYLKQFYPVIAFKSSTQSQSGNYNQRELSSFTKSQLKSESSELSANLTTELARSGCLGASHLIQLIKNYSRNLKMKKNLTVGVIGLPNVGKSSLINSLKRAKAVAVGNKPGITKQLQRVKLDNQITLIDSPGVMWVDGKSDARDSGNDSVGMALRNCLRVDQLDDPVGAATSVIATVGANELLTIYNITETDSAISDSEVFLATLARRMGKLNVGGVPNIETVSKIIVQDVNSGKIPFYKEPPPQTMTDAAQPGSSSDVAVVQQWAQEFDIEALLRGEGEVRVEQDSEAMATDL